MPPGPFPVTSTVSPITIAALFSNVYDAISASIGIIAILLLVFTLIGKELARTHGSPTREVGAWDVAVVPLVLSAGVIFGLRLLELLG